MLGDFYGHKSPCITSPTSVELGNCRIAASWVGDGSNQTLLPHDTPWSHGKHLGGPASCPGGTGEGVLSQGELSSCPFILLLYSKEEEVGTGVLGAAAPWAIWGSEPEKNLPSLPGLLPIHPHHPATLNFVLNHPKKASGRIFLGLLFPKEKVWRRKVGAPGRPSQEGLERIISLFSTSIFNWV